MKFTILLIYITSVVSLPTQTDVQGNDYSKLCEECGRSTLPKCKNLDDVGLNKRIECQESGCAIALVTEGDIDRMCIIDNEIPEDDNELALQIETITERMNISAENEKVENIEVNKEFSDKTTVDLEPQKSVIEETRNPQQADAVNAGHSSESANKPEEVELGERPEEIEEDNKTNKETENPQQADADNAGHFSESVNEIEEVELGERPEETEEDNKTNKETENPQQADADNAGHSSESVNVIEEVDLKERPEETEEDNKTNKETENPQQADAVNAGHSSESANNPEEVKLGEGPEETEEDNKTNKETENPQQADADNAGHSSESVNVIEEVELKERPEKTEEDNKTNKEINSKETGVEKVDDIAQNVEQSELVTVTIEEKENQTLKKTNQTSAEKDNDETIEKVESKPTIEEMTNSPDYPADAPEMDEDKKKDEISKPAVNEIHVEQNLPTIENDKNNSTIQQNVQNATESNENDYTTFCYFCNSKTDSECATNPKKSIACLHYSCYSLYRSDSNITTRGCLAKLPEEDKLYCEHYLKTKCMLCDEKNCNNMLLDTSSSATQISSLLSFWLRYFGFILVIFIALN